MRCLKNTSKDPQYHKENLWQVLRVNVHACKPQFEPAGKIFSRILDQNHSGD